MDYVTVKWLHILSSTSLVSYRPRQRLFLCSWLIEAGTSPLSLLPLIMSLWPTESGRELPEEYWAYDRCWIILGCLAFPAVIVIFWFMVAKPPAWW